MLGSSELQSHQQSWPGSGMEQAHMLCTAGIGSMYDASHSVTFPKTFHFSMCSARALNVSLLHVVSHLAPTLLLQIQSIHEGVCIWEVVGLHECVEEGILPESNAIHIALVGWGCPCGRHPAPGMRLEVKYGEGPAILFLFLHHDILRYYQSTG